ncbi:hypothetical protein AB4Y32_09845 [Paraburkholderia phymatum]|uniref:Uncharacterized protein n=1 Tax=Paraburkholderia phymatum TaxID=148447 RepID=A0ACC6TXN8_9BURK
MSMIGDIRIDPLLAVCSVPTKENINRYGPMIGRASEGVSNTEKDILIGEETARDFVA